MSNKYKAAAKLYNTLWPQRNFFSTSSETMREFAAHAETLKKSGLFNQDDEISDL